MICLAIRSKPHTAMYMTTYSNMLVLRNHQQLLVKVKFIRSDSVCFQSSLNKRIILLNAEFYTASNAVSKSSIHFGDYILGIS